MVNINNINNFYNKIIQNLIKNKNLLINLIEN